MKASERGCPPTKLSNMAGTNIDRINYIYRYFTGRIFDKDTAVQIKSGDASLLLGIQVSIDRLSMIVVIYVLLV